MNFFTPQRHNKLFQEKRRSSFVIPDSDEECQSFQITGAETETVIEDSDAESNGSEKHTSSEATSKSDDNQDGDSEEEDLQFMNESHRVSIVGSSSESENEGARNSFKSNTLNKLKRRSIYENPVTCTPDSKSTPINSHLQKRTRINVQHSDLDSSSERIQTVHRRQRIAIISDDDDDEENISHENKCIDLTKAEWETSSGPRNNHELKIQSNNNNFSKYCNNDNSEVIVCSTSTSESEIDPEVVLLAKKEIGVGNIDPIMAQKKEHLLLTINHTQSQLDRLNKLASSRDVIDLPDKGKKVFESVEELKIKLMNLKSELAELVEKSKMRNSIQTLKEIGSKINVRKSLINLSAGVEENIDVRRDTKDKRNYNEKDFNINVGTGTEKSKIQNSFQSFRETGSKKKNVRKSRINSSSDDDASENDESEDDGSEDDGSEDDGSEDDESEYDEKIHVKRDSKKNRSHNEKDFNTNNRLEDIPKLPQASFDVDELGPKALARLNEQQTLTSKKLEQLHGSLVGRPAENEQAEDPNGLKIQLMPHQKHALAWMKWRETQKPRGGILADDMGLGKTLSMISLILATDSNAKDSNDSSSDDEWFSRNKKNKRYYGGTLVVCPASLIRQWEGEVKNRCKRGLLSVLVYHGQNRNIEDRKLSKYDTVITTYQIIVREADTNTGFYRMEWNRIILDEAHYVRNHKSKACLSVCGLSAKKRWALTGTPIQNKEMDLYAILKFLRCSPFDELQVWKRWVDNKNDAGKQRLITIMKSIMLRRTKQELQSKGALDSLPDKSIDIVEINMHRDEFLVYQKIMLFSKNLFAQFLAQRADKQHMREMNGGRFDRPLASGAATQFTKAQRMLLDHHKSIEAHEILVLLLRLRQMCCHPSLLQSMLDKHDAEVDGIDEEDINDDLLNKLQNMSIHPDEDEDVEEHVANYKLDKKIASNLLTKRNPVFDKDRLSSKVKAVLETIKEILEKGEKLIVVSQWTSFLNIIAKYLDDDEDACFAMFTGAVAVKNRQAIIDEFNNPNGNTNILLLSLTAGGVGLNLVGANHLLLVDIHWNPQLEQQAQDRIYRFGQKKNVYIYKFICKDTIEERVKALQDKKMELANHVLTGTAMSSKLTMEDLKSLFS